MVKQYGELHTASEDARYYMVKFSLAEVEDYHDNHYTFIKNYMATRGISWEAIGL
jgi:hypothetical protein